MNNPFHSIRKQYTRGELLESQVDKDPLRQLDFWLADALGADCPEPTAMMLSTVGPDGRPSSRVVLMKGLDAEGIRFFTNYSSRKGRQLSSNPYASLLFFWPELERQVRIEGKVIKVSEEESDVYFDSRPAASRLSAAVSPQSEEITDRGELERLIKAEGRRQRAEIGNKEEEIGEGVHIKRPEGWGGYLLVPDYFEFWQGRADRLHDRIIFKQVAGGWHIGRLAP